MKTRNVIICEGDHDITIAAEGRVITAPLWVAELVNCGYHQNEKRLAELYRENVVSPAILECVITFASIATGMPQDQMAQTLQDVIRRHTH